MACMVLCVQIVNVRCSGSSTTLIKHVVIIIIITIYIISIYLSIILWWKYPTPQTGKVNKIIF